MEAKTWKDTVMGPVGILKVVKAVAPKWQGYADDYAIHESIAEAQAEITWDKAIREVVEWVEEESLATSGLLVHIHQAEWQAKLKEWNIKEERK